MKCQKDTWTIPKYIPKKNNIMEHHHLKSHDFLRMTGFSISSTASDHKARLSEKKE